MIVYEHGTWGMQVLLRLRGSVIPKALVWSVPCAVVTVILHLYWNKPETNSEMEGIDNIWSGFTFVLGFLIVFRSNQAYSRFWESVTLFHQISGEWTSAFSNILAFCSSDIEKGAQVHEFRQYLTRLMSLLHCSALQTTCELDDDSLEVLDIGAISNQGLLHFRDSPDRCETVLLWLERLIVEAEQSKLLNVPPPILSRAFQELSRGMVNMTNLKKIRDVPFPFPYAQFLSWLLVIHWTLTPLVASQTVLKPWWAGIFVFVVETSYWTLFYIAQEIDQPFGEDANDLPVREMQRKFNAKLDFFIQPKSYTLPSINLDASQHICFLASSFSVALTAQATKAAGQEANVTRQDAIGGKGFADNACEPTVLQICEQAVAAAREPAQFAAFDSDEVSKAQSGASMQSLQGVKLPDLAAQLAQLELFVAQMKLNTEQEQPHHTEHPAHRAANGEQSHLHEDVSQSSVSSKRPGLSFDVLQAWSIRLTEALASMDSTQEDQMRWPELGLEERVQAVWEHVLAQQQEQSKREEEVARLSKLLTQQRLDKNLKPNCWSCDQLLLDLDALLRALQRICLAAMTGLEPNGMPSALQSDRAVVAKVAATLTAAVNEIEESGGQVDFQLKELAAYLAPQPHPMNAGWPCMRTFYLFLPATTVDECRAERKTGSTEPRRKHNCSRLGCPCSHPAQPLG
ncbi:unnamed protein product [Symbiodinium pilosum]|uniref:Uncharacterized protein n=1 Tax=Symbiodinium pilosum TaxID=2952 RepID=A0A812NP20_SYMPI|nr:unnamed protein product [Symbiodinium pilosum]